MSNALAVENFLVNATAITINKQQSANQLTLTFSIDTKQACQLHWGLSRHPNDSWHCPPAELWPAHSKAFNERAVRTDFIADAAGKQSLQINLKSPDKWGSLPFVVYFPEQQRWLKNGNKDFCITLPNSQNDASLVNDAIAARITDEPWKVQTITLDNGDTLATATLDQAGQLQVILVTNVAPPVLLHWGIARKHPYQWDLPTAEDRPVDTKVFDKLAVRTPFTLKDKLSWLSLSFSQTGYRGINFILYQPETDRWLKAKGKDLYLPLQQSSSTHIDFTSNATQLIADKIIGAEIGKNSWTLMHRFNLAHDLVSSIEEDQENAMALLFTWLRYSAVRQLDWQRNYNTQPRELSHSQDRLTRQLAALFIDHAPSRPWMRLMLTTLGRGGEGQKVRDEILNIMHRHHLKEVHGTFMEEWHQKLHNNTTPDDIVICSAYLAFLESDGNTDRFYQVLTEGGVSRERLTSFERPIRTDPQFYPDKKHGLIHDFNYFLRILNSVHAGTDLETAVDAVRRMLDHNMHEKINTLLQQRASDAPPGDKLKTISETRYGLNTLLNARRDPLDIRELLYLDLALEQTSRAIIEQQPLSQQDITTLLTLTQQALRQAWLSTQIDEFNICARHLDRLMENPQQQQQWYLHAKSIVDRLSSLIGNWSNQLYQVMQPKAEYLGDAFAADQWAINLFSEEIIRGTPAFALSLVLRHLDPMLRTKAGLSGWQVISPAQASGQVRIVNSLLTVQGDHFSEATILITDQVSGDEEIPEGITSIITSDTPDLVSHVAVRARNAHVLFATCFDDDTYQQLKNLKDQQLTLQVTPAGDVEYHSSLTGTEQPAAKQQKIKLTLRRRAFSQWVIPASAFNDDQVGGKSNNLQALRKHIPAWIQLPTSIALPFGVLEQCLQGKENLSVAKQLSTLVAQIKTDPAKKLSEIRQKFQQITAPDTLRNDLLDMWRSQQLPDMAWEKIWPAIQGVWASQWNERAYYSRAARDIPHDSLQMAVLIQQVVEADYAFVIHTVNPITKNDNEIYVEMVLGMGETLVGNYPGRALSFLYHKNTQQIDIISYPSKSIGLYGSGVIFRSDSNGEDLESYAGAGLYDSLLATAPEHRMLDYSDEALLWDSAFREQLLTKVGQIGHQVEKICGSPQDIEGAIQQGTFYVVQTRPQVGI